MAERFDLDAIEADDALLDLLAAGGESAGEAGEHDPTLRLLAELRLAVEVEDELPVETIDDAEIFLARCAALNPVTDPLARKLAARGLAVGVAAVAALSVSGVAAAVSGDPLAPYEKVIEKFVEQLRPETSFPKEQLDGMPIVDKTKIVKVAKDYQDKQEQQHEAEARKAEQQLTDPFPIGLPELDTLMPKPPLARVEPPQVEKPTTTRDPLVPPVESTDKPIDDKPVDDKPADPPVDKPVDKPEVPGDDPTGEPVEPTPPPSEPSDPPVTPPAEPTPTPTPTPTDAPTNPGGGNGQQNETPTEPSTPPPAPDTGEQDDSGETPGGDTGSGETQPSGTEETKPAEQPSDGPSQPGGDQSTDDQTGTPAGGQGQDDKAKDEKAKDQAKDEARPAPPTPAEPTRLERYVDKQLRAAAKHSNGKYSLGYAKQQYPKGKHSNGQYVEGRHAAFERAHGSMSPVTLRQILWVLNHPTGR
ncbi:hypothetical protein Kfla_6027 [Kribbella flavida DSM 17836]|uniref:Uncharacterized protein n=1 Tax=Kribbella flavida (strain DSM 17836 / JCM 10339 / NBRC 14399) TaxID=479435 RepID=D2PSX8_KRIFD|nr:hypothetical protein [Kribbella flavida]ADB35030.1 hypothetical protein Kfla_6027 [Kribbella flavida DSM 17836]